MYYLNHTYAFSDYLSLKMLYKNIDVDEKIKSTGSDKRLIKNMALSWDKHGNIFSVSLSENQNFLQNKQDFRVNINRDYFKLYKSTFDLSKSNIVKTLHLVKLKN